MKYFRIYYITFNLEIYFNTESCTIFITSDSTNCNGRKIQLFFTRKLTKNVGKTPHCAESREKREKVYNILNNIGRCSFIVIVENFNVINIQYI